jgi:hypothetical protein
MRENGFSHPLASLGNMPGNQSMSDVQMHQYEVGTQNQVNQRDARSFQFDQNAPESDRLGMFGEQFDPTNATGAASATAEQRMAQQNSY